MTTTKQIRAHVVWSVFALTLAFHATSAVEAAPEGQLVWAVPFSLSPALFDPAEHQEASRR